MSIENQRVSLCLFLQSLAEEQLISIEELSIRTGIASCELASILQGITVPSIDQLIAVANELDMQLTFQHNLSFAHRKAAGRVK